MISGGSMMTAAVLMTVLSIIPSAAVTSTAIETRRHSRGMTHTPKPIEGITDRPIAIRVFGPSAAATSENT